MCRGRIDLRARPGAGRGRHGRGAVVDRGQQPTGEVPRVAASVAGSHRCRHDTSGLGDLNAFAAYLFATGDPKLGLGLGPQITVPTATQDETGSGTWQGRVAATVFNARSSDVQ
jgi:hypothetical protein